MHGLASITLPSANSLVRGALTNLQNTSNEALRSIPDKADQLIYFQAIQQWGAAGSKVPVGITLPIGNLPVRGALNNIQTTSTESLVTMTEKTDQLVYFQAIEHWGATNCKSLSAQGAKTHGAAG
jgi:hypothetical protein